MTDKTVLTDAEKVRIAAECGVFCTMPQAVAFYDAVLASAREQAKDAERLDWLDQVNAKLNAHYGTTYRWRLILSPNVVRLVTGRHDNGFVGDIELHDSDAHGRNSCREAIDAAIASGKSGEVKP